MLEAAEGVEEYATLKDLRKEIKALTRDMHQAASELAFEDAAELRDKIKKLQEQELAWL